MASGYVLRVANLIHNLWQPSQLTTSCNKTSHGSRYGGRNGQERINTLLMGAKSPNRDPSGRSIS
jgi:hypothetical protein